MINETWEIILVVRSMSKNFAKVLENRARSV
jgi:hypothetical protein